jgi:hypothetical protein
MLGLSSGLKAQHLLMSSRSAADGIGPLQGKEFSSDGIGGILPALTFSLARRTSFQGNDPVRIYIINSEK